MVPAKIGDADMTDQYISRTPRGRRIYVLRDGDELMIKRLELVGDRLIVQSDNPAWPTRVLDGTHDVEIIGEVVWEGHSV